MIFTKATPLTVLDIDGNRVPLYTAKTARAEGRAQVLETVRRAVEGVVSRGALQRATVVGFGGEEDTPFVEEYGASAEVVWQDGGLVVESWAKTLLHAFTPLMDQVVENARRDLQGLVSLGPVPPAVAEALLPEMKAENILVVKWEWLHALRRGEAEAAPWRLHFLSYWGAVGEEVRCLKRFVSCRLGEIEIQDDGSLFDEFHVAAAMGAVSGRAQRSVATQFARELMTQALEGYDQAVDAAVERLIRDGLPPAALNEAKLGVVRHVFLHGSGTREVFCGQYNAFRGVLYQHDVTTVMEKAQAEGVSLGADASLFVRSGPADFSIQDVPSLNEHGTYALWKSAAGTYLAYQTYAWEPIVFGSVDGATFTPLLHS